MELRPPASRALSLTDAIYASAVEPTLWSRFLEAFSDELGGAAIAMSLEFPGTPAEPEYYRARLSADYVPAFERHFRRGLPWPMTNPAFREGFVRANTLFPDARVRETDYYRDYMQPQGMAAEGPIAHLVVAEQGRPIAGISIQRLEDHRPFDDDDLTMCNLLAPHLARAHAIRTQLQTSRREQGAREEVLDRIPTGVVLIDARRRALGANRSGESILAEADGIRVEDGVLRVSGASNLAALDAVVDAALGQHADTEPRFAHIERPSGRRALRVFASRLLGRPTDGLIPRRLAALFVIDPESNSGAGAAALEAFGRLYALTPAETELVALLTEGQSLEELSSERGVTIHTTRSQLKQIFSKTGARRQPELVRMALTGISGVRRGS